VTLADWAAGGREVAVLGLGASGVAATRLLRGRGIPVYASDSGVGSALATVALALEAAGAKVELGGHDLDRIARAGAVVPSPGVPPEARALQVAREAGVPIRTEADLGLEALAGVPFVAITGTNGKTTTTALVAHLLAAGGLRAEAVGNIGTAVSEVALRPDRPEWLAVELSSFQLHDCWFLRPTVGILTNLSPDHLDRYPALADYYADKARLFRLAGPDSRWVLNADDPESLRLAAGVPGTRILVSIEGRADAWFDRATDQLMLGQAVLLPRRELQLLGDHNVGNALMAAAAAHAAGVSAQALTAGLASFRALGHRLEPVAEVDGVLWINDSKATNIASTAVALAAMERPYILLLGGIHKGEPYTRLIPALQRRCKAIVAYGAAEPLIRSDLEGAVRVESAGSDWDTVVATARRLAEPGDVILLSPACSSFDMFTSYGDRGARFRAAAHPA
jgi:UDP-N-acetylmuramoylalanine--D-glutamate ligase